MNLDVVVAFIQSLSGKYPLLIGVFAIAYTVGIVLKVLRSALESYVLQSPDKDDDLKLQKAEESSVGKVLIFLMDLLIRFKKPEAK